MPMFISMDLDDTLLNSKKIVTDYSLRVLKKSQEKGHVIIINTARSLEATKELMKLIKPDFTICNAGALILDKNNNIIHSDPIPEAVTNLVVQGLSKYTDNISIQTLDTLYNTYVENKNPKAKYYDISNGCYLKAYKILPYKITPEIAVMFKEKYNLNYTSYFGGNWSRFCTISSTKYLGLKRVVEYAKGSMEETMSFGDDFGDIDMILGSKIGVAMANSIPEVLEKVKTVTLSNDEDGVCSFIADYLKINI